MGHAEGPAVVKAFGASKMQRMEQAVRTLLEGIGEDVGREGLLDTPKVG
jgi:GTP cyclohydrolase I